MSQSTVTFHLSFMETIPFYQKLRPKEQKFIEAETSNVFL